MNQVSNIKNIIFDYGGVIIDIDYSLTEQAFEKLGVTDFAEHFNQLNQTRLFDDFEKGKLSEREFRERLNQQVGKTFSDEQIDEAWNAMLLGIERSTLKLLAELYGDFHTYLLSNTNLIHVKFITKYLIRTYGRANLDTLFDKVYYSFVAGFRKPEPEMFLKVINENTLRPAETLFIDDNLQNVEAAKSLGLQGVVFRKEDNLKEILRQYLHHWENSEVAM